MGAGGVIGLCGGGGGGGEEGGDAGRGIIAVYARYIYLYMHKSETYSVKRI